MKQDNRIDQLSRQLLLLEHKDRWSVSDRETFDRMKFELNKLKTLRLLDTLEQVNDTTTHKEQAQ
mgnify:CR=1 FL=1